MKNDISHQMQQQQKTKLFQGIQNQSNSDKRRLYYKLKTDIKTHVSDRSILDNWHHHELQEANLPQKLESHKIGLISFWHYGKENGFHRSHSFIVPEPKPFKDINVKKNNNDRMSYLFTSREREVFFFCAKLDRLCKEATVSLLTESIDDDDDDVSSNIHNIHKNQFSSQSDLRAGFTISRSDSTISEKSPPGKSLNDDKNSLKICIIKPNRPRGVLTEEDEGLEQYCEVYPINVLSTLYAHITNGTYHSDSKDKEISFLNPEPVLFKDGAGQRILAYSHFEIDDFAPCIFLHDLKLNQTIAKAVGGEVFLDFAPSPDFKHEGRISFFTHDNWFNQELEQLQTEEEILQKLEELEKNRSRPIVVAVVLDTEKCRKAALQQGPAMIMRNQTIDSFNESVNRKDIKYSPRLIYNKSDFIVGFKEKNILLNRFSKITSLPIKRDQDGSLLEFAITQEVMKEDGQQTWLFKRSKRDLI